MANYFSISELNSFDWLLKNRVIDSRYNSIPGEFDRTNFNPSGKYFQKWQKNDDAQVQLLSDFVPTLNFYKCGSRAIYRNIDIPPVANSLIGVSFKSYQAEFDFSDWDDGFYYGEITYGETVDSLFTYKNFEGIVTSNSVLYENGVFIDQSAHNGESRSMSLVPGNAYKFTAFCESIGVSIDPKLTLVVTKNGVTIFAQTITASPGAIIEYSGIVQSGCDYISTVTGADGGADVTPVNIPDDNPIVIVDPNIWQTSTFDVKEKHPKTLLLEYKNTYNTQNIIFQPTNIELNFRVEGWIAYIDPESDTEIYTDQEHNETLENAVPFFNETLYIGEARGVPEWVIRKVNLIFTLDQKKIDGYYYEKVGADSKFTPTRPENTYNQDAYWALPIIRNEDFFLDGYTVGDNPDENDIQVIVRSKEYLLNGGNISILGTFKKATTLSYIQITNRTLSPFNILIGITIGGSEFGAYPLTGNIVDTFLINKGFNVPSSLYITGLAGHDTDVWVEYHQLDDRTTIPISGSGGFVKGTVYIYEELLPGDFENDWDIATGLGQVGSKYEGCALSGTNGTIDRSHMAMVGWDRLLPATRDTSIGTFNNLITLDRSNLPAIGLNVNGLTINTSYRTGGNTQHAAANDPTAPLAKTENMGSAVPIDITNFSFYTVFFVKIVD